MKLKKKCETTLNMKKTRSQVSNENIHDAIGGKRENSEGSNSASQNFFKKATNTLATLTSVYKKDEREEICKKYCKIFLLQCYSIECGKESRMYKDD